MFFNQFKSSNEWNLRKLYLTKIEKITVSLVSLNPDRHIAGNHFPKTSRIARLTTLATLYAKNKQKRVQYGGPREKALSSVTTAISMDLMSPLGRAIRTICNPIIKVDGTVILHPVGSPLPRACWRLCCGFKCLLRPPLIRNFTIFQKDFFVFENSRLQKPFYNRIGDCQCSVLYFCLVWKARLYLYCRKL